MNHYGGARAALAALPDLARRGGASGPARIYPREEAERELRAAKSLGVTFLALGEPDYPRRLQMIDDAPPLLAVRGNLAALTQPIVAMVGARNASAAGMRFAERLAHDLGEAGFIIASGLARGIDAARRSGSLITSRLALEQSREVFAVPGSPLDPRAEGTNSLLKQGATLVTEAEDVIAVLRPILGQSVDLPVEEPGAAASPPHEPGEDERARIVELLGPTPVLIDDLVRLSGSAPGIVRTVLFELELAGRLERHGGGLVSLR